MRFPNHSSRLFLLLSLTLYFLVAIATIVTADETVASREAEATEPGQDPARAGYRVVASAPGFEIRADARNVYTRVHVPSPATETSIDTQLPRELATMGSSATQPAWRPFPMYGGTMTAVAVSPVDPNFVLAGLKHGYFSGSIYESHDGGVTWSPIEFVPQNPTSWWDGYVNDIEFTADGTAYVAADNAALRREPNGEWFAVRDLPYEYYSEIAVNPANTSEIWLASYNSYLAPRHKLWRSRDGGTTWDDVRPSTGDMSCTGIAFKATDTQIVVASFSFNGGKLWRSPDGGATWSSEATLTSNYTDVVYDGSRFVASAEWNQSAGIFTSSDDGLTWQRVGIGTWPSNQVYDLDSDPLQPGVVIASSLRGPFLYKDGAWRFLLGGARKYTTASSLFPGDPSRIIAGQEIEGVMRSVDGGASFVVENTGLLGLDVYAVAQNPLNPLEINVSFKAFNGGGLYTSLDGGATWVLDPTLTARMGDLEYAQDGTLYAYADGAMSAAMPEGIYRRNPNGVTWTPLGPFGSPTYFDNEVRCIRVDPLNPNTVIISGRHWPDNTTGIWRSTNRGASWTRAYTAPSEGRGSYLGSGEIEYVDNGTGATIMAADPDHGLLRSTDGGITWSNVATLPANVVGDFLRGSRADPGTFYLLGYIRSTGCVTHDGGITWSPFPITQMVAVGTDPYHPDILYGRALDTGNVLRSQDGGKSFSAFDDGCPLTNGHDFAWLDGPCPRLLYCSGAGLYFREVDYVAPQVSLVLEPDELWPPDRTLRTIEARVTMADACDASPSFALTAITVTDETGEPQDIVAEIGEGVTTFQLRAERSGHGDRRYLVTYTATDASGNTSQATAIVRVPHDRSVTAQRTGGEYDSAKLPPKTELVAIEPNPFNPATSAMLTVASPQRVTLDVYDVRGARVRTLVSGALPAGTHRIAWDGLDHHGRPTASGMYFFRFAAEGRVQTMKALLIK
jgi:FlgD Ig-like domain